MKPESTLWDHDDVDARRAAGKSTELTIKSSRQLGQVATNSCWNWVGQLWTVRLKNNLSIHCDVSASDSVVLLRHCGLYKFTYLLTYFRLSVSRIAYYEISHDLFCVGGSSRGGSRPRERGAATPIQNSAPSGLSKRSVVL